MNDYPKMLFRCAKPGEGIDVCEKIHVQTQIVDGEDAELAALDDGWRAHPAPPKAAETTKKSA
jgi:hypothetical protein